MAPADPSALPTDLPIPDDEGAALHLVGMRLPNVALPSTSGRAVNLDREPARVTVIYCYPRTGRPGEPSPGGDAVWDALPHALTLLGGDAHHPEAGRDQDTSD